MEVNDKHGWAVQEVRWMDLGDVMAGNKSESRDAS